MEWVQIFASATVAREQLHENNPRLLVVQGKRICLVLRNDRIHAFQDACTHSLESLSKGSINYLGEIICPGHGYRFSINTGRESNEQCRDLEMFIIREDETGVYIGI